MSLKKRILDQARRAIDTKSAFYLFLPKTDTVIDHGLLFNFHYYDSSLIHILRSDSQKRKTNPLLPPFDNNVHVCDLTSQRSNHYLLINKYMQCPGHVVISSMNTNSNQDSKLSESDFDAFEIVYKAFNFHGILYYNSGLNSGCSQIHKHIQYSPVENTPLLDAMSRKKVPFIVNHVVEIGQINSQNMMRSYNELLRMAEDDPVHDSYNFIISKGKAFYVPRKIPRFRCGTVFNSFSLSGNFMVWEYSDPLIKKQPLSVLKNVCFPAVK